MKLNVCNTKIIHNSVKKDLVPTLINLFILFF